MTDLLDKIMAFESGELDDAGTLELFSRLIKENYLQHLQGFYGRTARGLVLAGYLSVNGDILKTPGG